MNENIKPYGDSLDDGIVQLSFTLPVENGAKARKAAELYVTRLNFENVTVAHAEKTAENFTYFVVYAGAKPVLDYSSVAASEVVAAEMDFLQVNALIKSKLKRKMVAAGATIGTDAHTVGIDAIMNMKGYNQDYGLERYPEINALNMGAQVTCRAILQKGLETKADALLISQTVTQRDAHIRNFTELVQLLEAEHVRDRFLLIAGGARMTNDLAIELGYDAGFGSGTLPSQVATFIVTKLIEKETIHG